MNINAAQNSNPYQSFQIAWDKQASIRSKPRRIFSEELDSSNFLYYPSSRQPLCTHPLVAAKGKKAIEYILIQSAYKFMHEIAVVEVDIINNIATKIFNGNINFNFTDSMRNDTLAVIIDEAYHAYVANDFIQQVQNQTGVKPIKESRSTQFEKTISQFKKKIPNNLHDALEVIAICIGESTLTQELFDMSKEKDVHVLFRDIIIDHIADEGRHQILFRELFKTFWNNLEESKKQIIGPLIPEFLISYLCPDMHIEFDKSILRNLKLSNNEIDQIISEIYKTMDLEAVSSRIDPITKNIMKVIEYAGILDHRSTKEKFIEFKFLQS